MCVLLLAGLGARLYGLDWGERYYNPEERAIVNSVNAPEMSASYASSALPRHLLTLVASIVPPPDPETEESAPAIGAKKEQSLKYVARPISAVAGVLTILVLFFFGARYYSRTVGIVAAALLCFTVFHIQICHYYTPDALLCLLTILCVFSYARVAEKGSVTSYVFSALFTGMALVTASNALGLLLVFAAAFILSLTTENRLRKLKPYICLFVFLAVFSAVVVIAQAMLPGGRSVISLLFSKQPLGEVCVKLFGEVSRQISSPRVLFTGPAKLLQYERILPFLYLAANLCRWQFGWPLGLIVIFGLLYFIAKHVYQWDKTSTLLILWSVVSLAVIRMMPLKSPIYVIPFLPFLCLFGAVLLCDLIRLLRFSNDSDKVPPSLQDFLGIRSFSIRNRKVLGTIGLLCLSAVVLFDIYYSYEFLKIYRDTHPCARAKKWTTKRLPEGCDLLVEDWEDSLIPLLVEEGRQYHIRQNPVFMKPDYHPDKRRQILDNLHNSDYVILVGKRGHNSVLRLPDRFPMTSLYYKTLFNGDLGFDLVKTFRSPTEIFSRPMDDELADESFTIYDHPKVCVFKKTRNMSIEQIEAMLLSPTVDAQSLERRDIMLAKEGKTLWIPEVRQPLLKWILLVELLGLIAFPIMFPLCRGLADRGACISKCFGMLLFAFIVWFVVVSKFLPFTRPLAVISLGFLCVLAAYLYRKQWGAICGFVRSNLRLLLVMEIFYLGGLLLFALIRMNNPDVFWGEKPMNMSFLAAIDRASGFPPIDPWISGRPINYYYYGQLIVGILGKTLGLPPHYTFNLACAGIPALVMIVAFGILYNLTSRKLPGMIAGVFIALMGNFQSYLQILFNIVHSGSNMPDHAFHESGKRLLGFFLAKGFWAHLWYWILGTIESWRYALYLLFKAGWSETAGRVQIPLVGFNTYFWRTGHNIIPDTAANEFPAWSFLFADLHAHIIVMPFFLMFIALCLNLLLSTGAPVVSVRRLRGLKPEDEDGFEIEPASSGSGHYACTHSFLFPWRFIPYGLSLGAIACINAWDMPSSIAILFLTLCVLFLRYRTSTPPGKMLKGLKFLRDSGISNKGIRRWIIFLQRIANQVLLPFAVIFGTGILLYLPFHVNFSPAIEMGLKNIHIVDKNMTDPIAFGKIFLLFLFVLVSYLILRLHRITKGNLFILIPWLLLLLAPVVLAFSPVPTESIEGLVQTMLATCSKYMLASLLFPLLCLCGYLFLRRGNSKEATFGLLICLIGLGISIGLEIWYIKEFMGPRFNTTFKMHLEVWNLWSLVAAYFLYRVLDSSSFWPLLTGRILRRSLKTLWWGSFAFLVMASSVFMILGSYSLIATDAHSNRASFPTLNGLQFKLEENPAEYKAIHWMNRFIEGQQTITECEALHIYNVYSRISTYTGLPVLLGWDNHIKERGHSHQEINDRRKALEMVYKETDPRKFAARLDRWDVKYIYFGDLERNYRVSSLEHLKTYGHRLDLAYQDGDVNIFRVRQGWSADQMATPSDAIFSGAFEQEPGLNMFDSHEGARNGEFDNPRGMATDRQGNFYVADSLNHRIQKFDPQGAFLKAWGEKGALDEQFNEPNDLLVTGNRVYVLDTWNHRIQVFSTDGRFLGKWKPIPFYGPRGMAVDRLGRFYVADTGHARIVVLDRAGRLVRSFGEKGSGRGQFNEPTDVTVSSENEIYVVDSLNDRVQIFTMNGEYISEFPLLTARSENLPNEAKIAIRDNGNILVTDSVGNCVVEYSGEKRIPQQHTKDIEGKEIISPAGISISPDGSVIVTSKTRHSVQRIALK